MSEALRVLPGGRTQPLAEGNERSRTYDLALEDSVAGNAIMQPDLLDDLVGFLRPEAFYSERSRRVFETALALRESKKPIDLLTVADELRIAGRLPQVGGMVYLTELVGPRRTPVLTRSNVVAHGRRLVELWARRELALAGARLKARAEGDPADVLTVLTEGRTFLEALAGTLTASDASSRADAVVDRTLARVVAAVDHPGRGRRPTGYDAIDRLTAGLPDELVIIAGRPGMAKTALASGGIAINVARRGAGVMIASLETSDTDLMTRLICAHAGVNVQRALAGLMTREELARFLPVAKEIRALPMFVETDRPTARDLRDRARRLQLAMLREGRQLELVVVDYLQLVRPPRAGMKREQEVAETARALSAMAQELRVTVLALAQLNRDCEKRNDKRPQLSDLRESGEIEQAARIVLGLYRDDYYQRRRRDYRATGVAELAVLKQNNGPFGGVARLRFDEESTGFSSLEEPPHAASCRCAACTTADGASTLFPEGYEP